MLTLAEKIEGFITAEMNDALLYEALARIAPNDNDRQLLEAMANDEEDHAEEFKRIYQSMFGRSYTPTLSQPLLKSAYRDILKMRVLDETSDYRKYAYQYFQADPKSELKNAYYIAQTDENVHAIRLLYMLQ